MNLEEFPQFLFIEDLDGEVHPVNIDSVLKIYKNIRKEISQNSNKYILTTRQENHIFKLRYELENIIKQLDERD